MVTVLLKLMGGMKILIMMRGLPHIFSLRGNTGPPTVLDQDKEPVDFDAPPTIVEGHYVFWSVPPFVRPFFRSSVRSFVRLQVKVFGQGSF